MDKNPKFGPTENGLLTKEDSLKSKNARKQTHIKIQFYDRKKVTSFKIFILTFSPSPNAHIEPTHFKKELPLRCIFSNKM